LELILITQKPVFKSYYTCYALTVVSSKLFVMDMLWYTLHDTKVM